MSELETKTQEDLLLEKYKEHWHRCFDGAGVIGNPDQWKEDICNKLGIKDIDSYNPDSQYYREKTKYAQAYNDMWNAYYAENIYPDIEKEALAQLHDLSKGNAEIEAAFEPIIREALDEIRSDARALDVSSLIANMSMEDAILGRQTYVMNLRNIHEAEDYDPSHYALRAPVPYESEVKSDPVSKVQVGFLTPDGIKAGKEYINYDKNYVYSINRPTTAKESRSLYYSLTPTQREMAKEIRKLYWSSERGHQYDKIGIADLVRSSKNLSIEEGMAKVEKFKASLDPVKIFDMFLNSPDYVGGTRSVAYYGYHALKYDCEVGTKARSENIGKWLSGYDYDYNRLMPENYVLYDDSFHIHPMTFLELLGETLDNAIASSERPKDLDDVINDIAKSYIENIKRQESGLGNGGPKRMHTKLNNLPYSCQEAIAEAIDKQDPSHSKKYLRTFLDDVAISSVSDEYDRNDIRRVSRESLNLFRLIKGTPGRDSEDRLAAMRTILIAKTQMVRMHMDKNDIDSILKNAISITGGDPHKLTLHLYETMLEKEKLVDLTYAKPINGSRTNAIRAAVNGTPINEIMEPDWERTAKRIAFELDRASTPNNGRLNANVSKSQRIADYTIAHESACLAEMIMAKYGNNALTSCWEHEYPFKHAQGLRSTTRYGGPLKLDLDLLLKQDGMDVLAKDVECMKEILLPADPEKVEVNAPEYLRMRDHICDTLMDNELANIVAEAYGISDQDLDEINRYDLRDIIETKLVDRETGKSFEITKIDEIPCVLQSDWRNISPEYGTNLQAIRALTPYGNTMIIKAYDEGTQQTVYAHCASLDNKSFAEAKQALAEAIQDALYKRLDLSHEASRTFSECMKLGSFTAQDYRVITGACRPGTQAFLDEYNAAHPNDYKDWDSEWSPSEGIRATQGQYGHIAFMKAAEAWAESQNRFDKDAVVVTEDGIWDKRISTLIKEQDGVAVYAQGNDIILTQNNEDINIIANDGTAERVVAMYASMHGIENNKDFAKEAVRESRKLSERTENHGSADGEAGDLEL